ncbi:MAG: peptidoglycan DD-metalloendopeptidase family protein [Ignavibacteria bacterium]|nr:peptidoglycan DD-metalloendopeptidase family protein [Ignavibacteria bacterium]
MIKKISLILLLFTFSINFLVKADYDLKKDKALQIYNFKKDIEMLEDLILKNDFLIDKYKNELREFDNQISIITELLQNVEVSQLDSKEKLLLEEAELIKRNNKLEDLKSKFKQKIIWLYKHGAGYNLEVIFSSETLNQFYVRLEYLNKVSHMRKKDFDRIRNNQYLLEEKRKIYNLEAREKLDYITKKREDQRTLLEQKILNENTLKSLNYENENLDRQIEHKRKMINEIENYLSILKSDFIYEIDQKIDYTGKSFESLKQKLIIPVQSVNILFDFGESINPETRTITYNNGIDVSIAKGSDVKCIANGIVEDIHYIPTLGNVIIIKHDSVYKTIYATVEDIIVTKNSSVNAGMIIAKTSENLNGQSFHFELWINNYPTDPKFWFRR